MLSRASKYAVSAVLHITNTTSKKKKKGAKQIADELDIPAPFLSKTLQTLTKNKIITAVKGPNGGFYLTKNNQQKSLFNIIDCIDDIQKFNHCYLGQLDCDESNPCVVHHLYAPFKVSLIKKLKNKTILEMANEYADNNFTDIINDYH